MLSASRTSMLIEEAQPIGRSPRSCLAAGNGVAARGEPLPEPTTGGSARDLQDRNWTFSGRLLINLLQRDVVNADLHRRTQRLTQATTESGVATAVECLGANHPHLHSVWTLLNKLEESDSWHDTRQREQRAFDPPLRRDDRRGDAAAYAAHYREAPAAPTLRRMLKDLDEIADLIAQQWHCPVVESCTDRRSEFDARLSGAPSVGELKQSVVRKDMIVSFGALSDARRALRVPVTVEEGALKRSLDRGAHLSRHVLAAREDCAKRSDRDLRGGKEGRQMVESRRQTLEVERSESCEQRPVLADVCAGQLHRVQKQTAVGALDVENPPVQLRAPQEVYRSEFREPLPQPVTRPSPVAPIVNEFERVRLPIEVAFHGQTRAAAGARQCGAIALLIVGME